MFLRFTMELETLHGETSTLFSTLLANFLRDTRSSVTMSYRLVINILLYRQMLS